MAKRKFKAKGVRYWKKKAWDEFSKFIRAEAEDAEGFAECCTCGKPYNAFGKYCIQAGHYVQGRLNAVLFEEHCCHPQCYNCNVRLKGNTLNYREFMLRTYGPEETERIELLRYKVLKYSPAELEEIRDKYKAKYEELKGK